MLKKLKLKAKIQKEVSNLNSQPVESPFGLTEDDPLPKVKQQQPVRKKKKKKPREVIMFPEKTSSDSPRKSKLKHAPKEIEKMQEQLSNIVKVPKEQLDTFMDSYNASSKNISTIFLKSIAPQFLAFEDAMNYSTVALRDGLSYDGEIDLELLPLLEWSTRLNTLEIFLSTLKSMSKGTKDRIIRYSTIKAIEKVFNSKQSFNQSMSATHNKVAGIVTSLETKDTTKVKSAVDLINNLKQSANKAKDAHTPGVVAKKKQRP